MRQGGCEPRRIEPAGRRSRGDGTEYQGTVCFRKFLVEGTEPNRKKIAEYVDRSLMLVTALAPVIGYDKASKIAHHAADHDLTLREAALKLGLVDQETFDRVVDPAKMVRPYVATKGDEGIQVEVPAKIA